MITGNITKSSYVSGGDATKMRDDMRLKLGYYGYSQVRVAFGHKQIVTCSRITCHDRLDTCNLQIACTINTPLSTVSNVEISRKFCAYDHWFAYEQCSSTLCPRSWRDTKPI